MGFISEDGLKYRKTPDLQADAFQLVLYSLALGLNAQLIYEIGVGQSTLALLRAVERTGGKVVSCDINANMLNFVADIATFAMPHWTFHNLSSEKMWEVVHDQADLIFIDGCHSYTCIKWEVENYWQRLKPDGLMVLHDTRSWPDGPSKVFQLCQIRGLEVLELPMCHGLGLIHKQVSDSEVLRLE